MTLKCANCDVELDSANIGDAGVWSGTWLCKPCTDEHNARMDAAAKYLATKYPPTSPEKHVIPDELCPDREYWVKLLG